jgi:hypothetical protein
MQGGPTHGHAGKLRAGGLTAPRTPSVCPTPLPPSPKRRRVADILQSLRNLQLLPAQPPQKTSHVPAPRGVVSQRNSPAPTTNPGATRVGPLQAQASVFQHSQGLQVIHTRELLIYDGILVKGKEHINPCPDLHPGRESASRRSPTPPNLTHPEPRKRARPPLYGCQTEPPSKRSKYWVPSTSSPASPSCATTAPSPPTLT